jgi:Caspase domain
MRSAIAIACLIGTAVVADRGYICARLRGSNRSLGVVTSGDLGVQIASSRGIQSLAKAEPAARKSALRRKLALLIGCSKYESLPDLSLKGPINDVSLWARLLQRGFDFDPGDISILAEPIPNAKADIRPSGRPTNANIRAEFQRLVELAAPEASVFILISGHGARFPALGRPTRPEVLGPDGMNAVFLPADAKQWSGDLSDKVIRHEEFGEWLDQLRQKGANVWIMFDCCHAGALSRGASREEIRGVEPETLGVSQDAIRRAAENYRDAMQNRIAATPGKPEVLSQQLGVVRRGGKQGSLIAFFAAQYWDPAPSLICPPGAPLADDNWYGLLSYTVAQCVTQQHFHGSFRRLAEGVATKIRERRGSDGPTPGFDGDLDRELFASTTPPRSHGYPILTTQNGELRLAAGDLHGLSPGTILAIQARASGPDKRVRGYVMVESKGLGLTTAAIAPCSFEGRAPMAAADIHANDDEAVVVLRDLGKMRVKLATGKPNASSEQWTVLDSAVGSISAEVAGMIDRTDERAADWILRVVTPDEAKQTFGIAESAPRTYLLQTAHTTPASRNTRLSGFDSATRLRFPRVFGRYSIDNSKQLSQELEIDLPKIYQWQNLWRIANALASSGGDRSRGIELELMRLQAADSQQGVLLRDATLYAGDLIGCRIRNRMSSGLWVTMIFAQADFSIDVVKAFSVGPQSDYPIQSFPITTTGPSQDLPSVGPEGLIVLAVPMENSPVAPDFQCLVQEPLGRAPAANKGSLHYPNTPFGKLLEYGTRARGLRRGQHAQDDPSNPIVAARTWVTSPGR